MQQTSSEQCITTPREVEPDVERLKKELSNIVGEEGDASLYEQFVQKIYS